MKKIFLLFLVSAMTIAFLTACSGGTDTAEVTSSEQSAGTSSPDTETAQSSDTDSDTSADTGSASAEDPPTVDGLPMFTVVEDGDVVGEESVDTNDIQAVRDQNPWRGETELDTLPVYAAYPFDRSGVDPDDIAAVFERELGADAFTVSESFGSVGVTLSPAIELADEYKVIPSEEYTSEEWEARAGHIARNYGTLLNMENPTMAEAEYGVISFYDASGDDLRQMMNYCFDRVDVSFDEDGNLYRIAFSFADLSEKLGDYHVITEDEARGLFDEGHYFATSFPASGKLSSDDIAAVELVYRTPHTAYFADGAQSYFVPYYCFYVDIHFDGGGAPRYAMAYVPAIDGKYILNMP